MTKKYYTVYESAMLLDIGLSTLYRHINEKNINATRKNHKYHIAHDDLFEFKENLVKGRFKKLAPKTCHAVRVQDYKDLTFPEFIKASDCNVTTMDKSGFFSRLFGRKRIEKLEKEKNTLNAKITTLENELLKIKDESQKKIGTLTMDLRDHYEREWLMQEENKDLEKRLKKATEELNNPKNIVRCKNGGNLFYISTLERRMYVYNKFTDRLFEEISYNYDAQIFKTDYTPKSLKISFDKTCPAFVDNNDDWVLGFEVDDQTEIVSVRIARGSDLVLPGYYILKNNKFIQINLE